MSRDRYFGLHMICQYLIPLSSSLSDVIDEQSRHCIDFVCSESDNNKNTKKYQMHSKVSGLEDTYSNNMRV